MALGLERSEPKSWGYKRTHQLPISDPPSLLVWKTVSYKRCSLKIAVEVLIVNLIFFLTLTVYPSVTITITENHRNVDFLNTFIIIALL